MRNMLDGKLCNIHAFAVGSAGGACMEQLRLKSLQHIGSGESNVSLELRS